MFVAEEGNDLDHTRATFIVLNIVVIYYKLIRFTTIDTSIGVLA